MQNQFRQIQTQRDLLIIQNIMAGVLLIESQIDINLEEDKTQINCGGKNEKSKDENRRNDLCQLRRAC